MTILKEQATFLSGATDNLLEGRVKHSQSGDVILVDFFIGVPVMDNYEYHGLRVQHEPVMIYPMTVTDQTLNAPSTSTIYLNCPAQ